MRDLVIHLFLFIVQQLLPRKYENVINSHHVFRKVSLDCKLNSAKRTSEFAFSLVVCRLLVVLQRRPVAEDCRTERTGDDLTCVCRSDVTIQTGASRELRIAFVALEIFLTGVRFHVAGQRFPVFEGRAALRARERLVGGRVEVFVNGQVVLPGKGLEAEVARVTKVGMGLVRSLVSFQAVAPLEGLAAI